MKLLNVSNAPVANTIIPALVMVPKKETVAKIGFQTPISSAYSG